MSTALIVIDMQRGLFAKKIKVFKEAELISNINLLIDAFHKRSLRVYFVRHTNKTMTENSPEWRLHPDLHVRQDAYLFNKTSSSVFKEKSFQPALAAARIKQLVIVGLVTHGCVKAACEDAVKLGYQVVLAADGHSSFNQDAEGLIEEWNQKLAAEGVDVRNTCDIIAGM